MDISSPWRVLLQSLVRIERPTVSLTTALRNALGVAVPLWVGLATGRVLTGLTIAIGALIVSSLDQADPYPLRIRHMLLASLIGCLAVWAGATTAAIPWLSIAVIVLWGFGAGLAVALGTNEGQVGLASLILLVVFSGGALPPKEAAVTGALVLLGGVLQSSLTATGWLLRSFGPEYDALADVFEALAAYARAPDQASLAPPLTAETTAARTMLSAAGNSPAGDALRTLLDEAERVRLVLIALNDDRHALRRKQPNSEMAKVVDRIWGFTVAILEGLARSLRSGQASPALQDQVDRLEAEVQAARKVTSDPKQGEAVVLAETLVTQLLAVLETTSSLLRLGFPTRGEAALALPATFELRYPVGTLRANLTLHSAAFRHAIRLAASLGIAAAIVHGLDLPHGYWVALTVAIVLRPDFSATFVRGGLRIGGTLLGLVIATLMVQLVRGSVLIEAVLVAFLVFGIRRLIAQNYGLAVICITSLVVIFLSFAGVSPETTIAQRGLATLVGGVLALTIYPVWPTWERGRAGEILADLLDAYRQYFDAVMGAYLDPGHLDTTCLGSLRIAARLARANAEASIDRLRAEPERSETLLDRLTALLAASNRFVRATMALEAQLYAPPTLPAVSGLSTFIAAVDTILQSISPSLRCGATTSALTSHRYENMRALAREIAAETGLTDDDPERRLRRTAFLRELERIVDSVDAMIQIIKHQEGQAKIAGEKTAEHPAA